MASPRCPTRGSHAPAVFLHILAAARSSAWVFRISCSRAPALCMCINAKALSTISASCWTRAHRRQPLLFVRHMYSACPVPVVDAVLRLRHAWIWHGKPYFVKTQFLVQLSGVTRNSQACSKRCATNVLHSFNILSDDYIRNSQVHIYIYLYLFMYTYIRCVVPNLCYIARTYCQIISSRWCSSSTHAHKQNVDLVHVSWFG